MRADGDDRLAASIARRADIPPRLFRQLLAQATEVVRKKLLASAPPSRQDAINRILAEISAQVSPAPVTAEQSAKAQRLMKEFSQDVELLKVKILEFASLERIAEVVAGLSLLSVAPFEQIERLFFALNGFGLMVLCKMLAFDWQVTSAIILASQAAKEHHEELRSQYGALSVASAQRLFRFWQGRQNVLKYFHNPR
jgi:hypothetical protein